MTTYHHHRRGGKLLAERPACGSITDEEYSDFETKMTEELADIGRRIKEDERKNKELLKKLNNLEQSLMPVPNRPEIPTTSAEVTDKEIHESGQLLEQTGNASSIDSGNSSKNNTEPPPKKRKKKKQSNVEKSEETFSLTTNSSPPSLLDVATSLQLSETNVDPAQPKEDYNATAAPPTTSETELPINRIEVLVRGLPTGINTDHISFELAKTGIKTQKVIQFKRKVGVAYRLLPLFLTILIVETDQNQQIFSVTNICDLPVKIERFRGGRSPIQCYNYQNYGHTQRICNSQPRCLKCAADHRYFECHKDINTPPKCCNCGEAHTANYTGCSIRPPKRGPRATPATIPSTTTGQAHRLVSIIKELKEL